MFDFLNPLKPEDFEPLNEIQLKFNDQPIRILVDKIEPLYHLEDVVTALGWDLEKAVAKARRDQLKIEHIKIEPRELEYWIEEPFLIQLVYTARIKGLDEYFSYWIRDNQKFVRGKFKPH